jgi:hypothetical protein
MSYELLDRGSFLQIRFFGVLESKDFANLFSEFLKYEEESAIVPNRISTLSDMDDFIIQFSKMLPIAEHRKQKRFIPQIKSAIVASRPIEMAIAGMLKCLNMNTSIIIQVFSTFAEAEKWVGEHP